MTTVAFKQRDRLLLKLRDGTPVLLRPVTPEDRERLVTGMAQLSENSRYFRFFTPAPRLTEEQIRYFTEVDQQNHVAWIAVNPVLPGQPGLGIGRFVRCEDQSAAAEIALTVIDAAQRKGLGTALLAVLCVLALERGVRTFHGLALSEHRVVTGWLARLGAGRRFAAGVCHLELPVRQGLSYWQGNPSAEV